MKSARAYWPVLVMGLGVLALTAELFALSVLPRREYGLPIGMSELGELLFRSTFIAGPFALFLLLAGAAREKVWQRGWALLGIGVGLASAFMIYDAWTEVENPGAESFGLGLLVILEWVLAVGCLAAAAVRVWLSRGHSV